MTRFVFFIQTHVTMFMSKGVNIHDHVVCNNVANELKLHVAHIDSVNK